ncbi:putative brct domain containing protein [Neofusicoccum parvum UCRNP2]|uniref:Putative brct domain containing protein n=1 Tax=Botryosphaeria parva (strain UCR-NP2) TaxID=1287680 RepID=R1GZK6_BOTPV|nr:putative brct domain containing protein [Neofusicoccum parvum UCRNP2]
MGLTHLVTTPEHWKRQSPEVIAASSIPYCNIVSVDWLMACLRSGEHQSEVLYLLELAFPVKKVPQHRLTPVFPVMRLAPAAPKTAISPAPVKNILRLDRIPKDDRPFAIILGNEVQKLRRQAAEKKAEEKQNTMAAFKKHVGEMHLAVHSELEEKAKAYFAIGKEIAKRDLNSECYHTYRDHSGFYFQEIALTRLDVMHNTNERITLTIYESDFSPHNYITHQNWYAADGSCQSLQLVDGVDFQKAWVTFRTAFRKHTRISWEHRMISPAFVSNEMRKWEEQKREALVFAKIGEYEDSSRSPSPSSDTPSKKRKDSVRAEDAEIERRARKRQKMNSRRVAENILTKEELEICLVNPFKYVPPHPGEAQGTFPDPRLMGGWVVIPGDEPNDDGFSLPIEHSKR